MQTVSALYKRLLAEPEHVRETKVNIAGVDYGQDNIYACSTSGDLLLDATAGNCFSREIDLIVMPIGTIPRMAAITPYTRLVLGDEQSEWIPRGMYYVDTRYVNEVTGLMTLHGFDAMLKAEAVWWDPSVDAGEWPMSQEAAVVDIARQMGVSIDPRTAIDPALTIDYPNELTMREILAEIAAAHGGNWIMTDDGELLLMPLGSAPSETHFLVDGMDGGAILFGDVRIIV